MSFVSDLAIVLLNWDQAYQTLDSVKMISSWKRVNPLIIIVDNGSSYSDRAILQKGANVHHLILNSNNRGYAGGNNDGIKLALEKGCRSILLLNTDATVTEECVMHLISCLEMEPELGVVGPLLEQNEEVFCGGRNIGLYSNTKVIWRAVDDKREVIPVDYVSGTVFLARSKIINEVGFLEESYFFSGEVADFCKRTWTKGYRCAIYTRCTARHNTEQHFLRMTLYPYYSLRNRFLYIQKNVRYLSAILTMRWIISGMLSLIIAYLRGNRPLSRSLRLAIKDGVTGRFGNQNQRVSRIIYEK